jgi:hypothetical protein
LNVRVPVHKCFNIFLRLFVLIITGNVLRWLVNEQRLTVSVSVNNAHVPVYILLYVFKTRYCVQRLKKLYYSGLREMSDSASSPPSAEVRKFLQKFYKHTGGTWRFHILLKVERSKNLSYVNIRIPYFYFYPKKFGSCLWFFLLSVAIHVTVSLLGIRFLYS